MSMCSITPKCRECGSPLEACREGHVLGLFCRECDWASLKTYPVGVMHDLVSYEVKITRGDFENYTHLNVVAQLANMDLWEARELLKKQRSFVVFTGLARQVIAVRALLSWNRLKYVIEPGFPW